MCFNDGLEAHPGYIDEYEGETALLRATRCPNEECKHHRGNGVPVDSIEIQLEKQSLVEKISSGANVQTIGVVLLVIIGGVFLANNFLGLGLLGPSSTGGDIVISGQIVDSSGSGIKGTNIEAVGTNYSTESTENGYYELGNLTEGNYTLSIVPNSSLLGATSADIRVNSNGSINSQSTNNVTVDGSNFTFELQQAYTATEKQQLSNSSLTVNFANPANSPEGVNYTLSPPPGETFSDSESVKSGNETEVNIPGVITSQEWTIRGGVVTDTVSQTRTWTGGSDSITIVGNEKPEDFTINLSEGTNSASRNISKRVSDGSSFSTDVRGTMTSELNVTISGGSASAPTVQSGTYTNSNPTIDIGEQDAPALVEVTLSGEETSNQETESGTVGNGYATFDIEGTLPARNAEIVFTGGNPQNDELANTNIQANGEQGTDISQRELLTVERDGQYKFTFNFEEQRNSDLVAAGYQLNGDLTRIESGQSTQTLELSQGDRISLWLRAERDSFSQEKRYKSDSPVNVISQEVTTQNVEPGEPISITAVAENTGDSSYSAPIRLFKDGEEVDVQNSFFSQGEQKEITFEDISFEQEGVHTVSVNDGEKIDIQVGDGTPPSGEGTLNGNVTILGDGGSVSVDTNGDNSTDCSVSAIDGRCDLTQLQTGQNEILVSQTGVKRTNFEVQYTERSGPRDVSVDVDSDGVPDAQQSGVLSEESITASKSLGAGTNAIIINVGNNEAVDYEISWTESGQVTQPEIRVDGDTVIDINENFKGERTEQISALDSGSHTFEILSGNNSNTFNVELQWTESGDALYPSIFLESDGDEQELCVGEFENDQTCSVSSLSLSQMGPYNIRFGSDRESIMYGITYTAKATPESVNVNVNGRSEEFLRLTRDRVDDTQGWIKTANPGLVSSGDNTIEVETGNVNGLSTSAVATVDYTYTARKPKNPVISVTKPNGDTNTKRINSSKLTDSGVLAEESTGTLPQSWFGFGENIVTVRSTNGGVMELRLEATMSQQGNITTNSSEQLSNSE